VQWHGIAIALSQVSSLSPKPQRTNGLELGRSDIDAAIASRIAQFFCRNSNIGWGTFLFSEPQPNVQRLVDITAFGWENLGLDAQGLHIAATCTIAALSRFVAPPEWRAAELIGRCCNSLLGSFKREREKAG
jgi:hypothetical protein